MAISDETIRKVKESTDILDVISEFVTLKKKGQNWFGLSPFSNEKTPSFSVSPAKGIFKDFSSGKAGDAISFLMEHEGLGYIEAIKYLAKKYSIEIEETEVSDEDRQKANEIESLYIALNFANDTFVENLHKTSEGKNIGLSYFKERGFLESTIRDFSLGFALKDWDSLLKKGLKQQFSEEILEKAGLIIRKDEKTYDRFRDRVVFPIHNLIGKVVGFGARTLSNDKKQPKYINSPETPVYNKSKILYGFFQAKNEIRNSDECLLVEGYTDVISMHQGGIENVISSSGTALTEDQVKIIKRFTKNLTLIFDADEAGQRAAERGIKIGLKAGMNIQVLTLPEGADPDSFMREKGTEKFLTFIKEKKKDFLNFKTISGLEETKGQPFKKAQLIRDIAEIIALIPDPITRSVYFKACSNLLGIEEEVLIADYNKKQRELQQKAQYPRREEKRTDKDETYIEDLVNLESFKSSDSAFKEKEILKSLLNYANIIVEDEDCTLGEFLLDAISDVEFHNTELVSILNIYKKFINSERFPEYKDFLENDELTPFKNTVIDIITEKHSVSDNWAKHNIHVPKDDEILLTKVYTDIYRLKWQKVKELKEKARLELKELNPTETSDEEYQKLLKQFSKLKSMEKEISQELGNVIS